MGGCVVALGGRRREALKFWKKGHLGSGTQRRFWNARALLDRPEPVRLQGHACEALGWGIGSE